MIELAAHQRAQSPEGLAHVGGPGAQPDSDQAIESDHPLWLSLSSMLLPRLSAMFQSGPEDDEAPINRHCMADKPLSRC